MQINLLWVNDGTAGIYTHKETEMGKISTCLYYNLATETFSMTCCTPFLRTSYTVNSQTMLLLTCRLASQVMSIELLFDYIVLLL